MPKSPESYKPSYEETKKDGRDEASVEREKPIVFRRLKSKPIANANWPANQWSFQYSINGRVLGVEYNNGWYTSDHPAEKDIVKEFDAAILAAAEHNKEYELDWEGAKKESYLEAARERLRS